MQIRDLLHHQQSRTSDAVTRNGGVNQLEMAAFGFGGVLQQSENRLMNGKVRGQNRATTIHQDAMALIRLAQLLAHPEPHGIQTDGMPPAIGADNRNLSEGGPARAEQWVISDQRMN